ncbi:hypothetical protein ACRRVB_01185 [Candidatus Cardinium hertigii]|uniref:hypothetical protein n=1 Tax=Candidatus Cardinium hertigii TaxID=247481 RepID=UPI003D7CC72B
MVASPTLFNPTIGHTVQSDQPNQSRKRPKVTLKPSVVDEYSDPQRKKCKILTRIYGSTAMSHKKKHRIDYTKKRLDELRKEILNRLPNNKFFTLLKFNINTHKNKQLSQDIIEQLEALDRLKIPYTFLSSILACYTKLETCNCLLNKILVKCDRSGYTIEPKLQNLLQAYNIKLNSLSSMLSGSGSKAAVAYQNLINTITEKNNLVKLMKLKELGFRIKDLSSMLGGSGRKAAVAYQNLINTITEEDNLVKLMKLKKLGFRIKDLSSILHASGNKAASLYQYLINTATQAENLDKLTQLKESDYSIGDVLRILHQAGKQAARTSRPNQYVLTQ